MVAEPLLFYPDFGCKKMMTPPTKSARRFNPWFLLLALPYAGLCFPQTYARATPALFGFPFFYWYQFAWVVLASLLIGIVYLKTRR